MSKLMTPNRAYLLRAFYEWIIDNECTPYVIINANYPGTAIPHEYAHEGRIVLDISPLAVKSLNISNEYLEFNARFNGASRLISAPIAAVMAIYAQENGHGTVFNDDAQFPSTTSTAEQETKPVPEKKRPALKIVK